MAGIRYDYCQTLSPLASFALGKPLGEALGGAAGTICTVVRGLNNYDQWETTRKQCNGYQTPKLRIAPFKLKVENLIENIQELGHPDAWAQEVDSDGNFYYTLDFWFGVEGANAKEQCFWIGIDGGPESGLRFCLPFHCGGEPVQVSDIRSAVEDLLDELAGAVDKDSMIDLIIKTVGAIVMLAIALIVAYLMIQISPALLAGAAVGGAIVGAG